MSAYYDTAYTRQFIPMVTFQEWLSIANATITSLVMVARPPQTCPRVNGNPGHLMGWSSTLRF